MHVINAETMSIIRLNGTTNIDKEMGKNVNEVDGIYG